MGNGFNSFASNNINQTQITSINQTCNLQAQGSIENISITAINSHVGDITLSDTLTVGDMSCVLNAVSQASAQAAVTNTAVAQIASLPFQQTINSISITDITQVQSFQQSVINQACQEVVKTDITDVTLTFIDTSTGNIKIATSSQIDSLSCNMTASSYQSATATVVNSATGKISAGCCGFDLGMLVPVLLGLVGLVVVSKMAGSKKAGADGGPKPVDPNTSLIQALTANTQGYSRPPSASMSGTRATVAPTSGRSIAVQV